MPAILNYVDLHVRTARPRTWLRTVLRLALRAARLLLLALRLSILAAGYLALAAGVGLNLALVCIARVLLFVGALRWTRIATRTLAIAQRIDAFVLQFMKQMRPWLPRVGRAGASR